MAKYELHNRALDMRKLGMSYSQIKQELKVGKSTLSLWLQNYPLSPERIKELKTNTERQIERIRQTKARKKEDRIANVYAFASNKIGSLTGREFFIAGILLYWAEGTKASSGVVYMTNTDPAMLKFFMRWLDVQGAERSRLRIRLHLYVDMDIEKETRFWMNTLEVPRTSFQKPYIKESFSDKRKNYKGRFGHGTCNLMYCNRDLYELIMMSIKYLGDIYSTHGFPKERKV